MHIGRTISAVQTPIIPVIGEWTRNTLHRLMYFHGKLIRLSLLQNQLSVISLE